MDDERYIYSLTVARVDQTAIMDNKKKVFSSYLKGLSHKIQMNIHTVDIQYHTVCAAHMFETRYPFKLLYCTRFNSSTMKTHTTFSGTTVPYKRELQHHRTCTVKQKATPTY